MNSLAQQDLSTLRILHVTEAMGGGTESAIREFARADTQDEHHLLFRVRQGSASDASLHGFSSATAVYGSLGRLRRAIREQVAELNPQVMHLHSSWAGLIGRGPRMHAATGIVYSPHCFYFERKDIGPVKRRIAESVERRLAPLTDVLVAVSPHEARLAKSHGVTNAVFVPNLLRGWTAPPSRPAPSDRTQIATVGRISRQKDPEFLLDVRRAAGHLGLRAEWVWIGDGDERLAARLRQQGVTVTGWLSREEARARLACASVYVHTAAWESGPVSLEEARIADVPIVARSIASLVSLGYPSGLDTPDEVARQIKTVLDRDELPRASRAEERAGELDAQVESLRAAYKTAARCWSAREMSA